MLRVRCFKCQIRYVRKSFKMELLKIVICSLCFSLAYCATGIYKAAVVDAPIVSNENQLVSMVHHAAQLNVDILMLPKVLPEQENIQKIKETISSAAKEAKIYVTTQTVGKSPEDEEIRNNLIFDRSGEVVRKPLGSDDVTPMDTFTSDFGVAFGVVMEHDLLRTEHLEGIRNVIAFGPSIAEASFLYVKQFPGSWSFTARSNLITTSGVYGGPTIKNGGLIVAELKSDLPDTFTVERVESVFPIEDLSQYTSKPLQTRAVVVAGYQDTVCHDKFCCEFDVKTSTGDELPYSLVAYDSVHHSEASGIGVQTCAVVACVGHHNSCYMELERNKTKTVFEKLSISAFFSRNSVQYPLIISSSDASYDDFKFIRSNESDHASIELTNKNISCFGIISTVPKDLAINRTGADVDLNLEAVAADVFQEFFDYVWIRLRVVIFIASIYVLEML